MLLATVEQLAARVGESIDTPEEVALAKGSYTGQYLAPMLETAARRRKAAAASDAKPAKAKAAKPRTRKTLAAE